RPYPGEVLFQADQPGLVELSVETRAVQHLYQALRGVVPRSQAERADRRIHAVRSRFDRLHQADQRDSRRGVHVNMYADRLPAGVLDSLDDVEGRLRLEQ